jgi:AcrR family transcriptional regulator
MKQLDPKLHRALDGELPLEELSPELHALARRLERAAHLLREREVPVGASVIGRVATELRRPRPRLRRRVLRWLTERHAVTIAMRPIWSLALAAVLAAVVLIPSHGPGLLLGTQEGIAQFVGHFPGARSVDVVGPFTDWRAGVVALRDDDHDGVWSAVVVLPAGVHEYMFVVDGERWIADPLAGRYVADGFGRQNALVIVRPAGGGGRGSR